MCRIQLRLFAKSLRNYRKSLSNKKGAFVDEVDALAEFLWTSPKEGMLKMEFCSLLNLVIRQDQEKEIQSAVIIVRAINTRRVKRENIAKVLEMRFPADGLLYRGTGFRNGHKNFFDRNLGKQYRIPGFLATSSDREVAEIFLERADRNHPRVLWTVKLDPKGETDRTRRVKHMAFVSSTLVPGEGEYLFSPYSAFKITNIKWGNDLTRVHEIVLQPALDNTLEPEDLPLAPWY